MATSRLEGEAEINGSRDTIEAEGTGFSGFFSIKAETVYLEASYTRNELDYEMSRNTAAYGLSAIGETKGTSSIARLQAGWHRSFGEWLLTAEVGVDRVKAQIDSFTESGAIHLNLLVPTLTPHSTQWHGRVQLAREISCGALRLSLYGAAEFIHEPSPTPQEFTLVLAGRTGVSGASIAGETPVGQRNLWRGQIGVAGALTDKLRFNVEGVTSLNRDYGKQTAVQAALNYHF